MPLSPIVLLNDVGRTDTFEIKSPSDNNNLLPPAISETKKNLPDGKTIQEFLKKLDYHENKLFNIVRSNFVSLNKYKFVSPIFSKTQNLLITENYYNLFYLYINIIFL